MEELVKLGGEGGKGEMGVRSSVHEKHRAEEIPSNSAWRGVKGQCIGIHNLKATVLT